MFVSDPWLDLIGQRPQYARRGSLGNVEDSVTSLRGWRWFGRNGMQVGTVNRTDSHVT